MYKKVLFYRIFNIREIRHFINYLIIIHLNKIGSSVTVQPLSCPSEAPAMPTASKPDGQLAQNLPIWYYDRRFYFRAGFSIAHHWIHVGPLASKIILFRFYRVFLLYWLYLLPFVGWLTSNYFYFSGWGPAYAHALILCSTQWIMRSILLEKGFPADSTAAEKKPGQRHFKNEQGEICDKKRKSS